MNILLIGSGGREHALGWKIAQSPLCDTLFIAPGNGGTGAVGRNVDLAVADHDAVVAFCRSEAIGLVVVGPEVPLVAGLADDLRAAGFDTFGPSAAAAQLEGSKAFTKEVCDRANVPTAAWAAFEDAASAQDYLAKHGAPIVVKADGLAAGKGVTVALTTEEAAAAIDHCFADGPGRVVLEEMLEGEEASMFFLCDGTRALACGTAQDHKRAYDGDTGPNTGGMGAVSPAALVDAALETEVMQRVVQPTLDAMVEAGMPFSGVLYAGLMIGSKGPQLIEYNVRFGDPECQVLMARMTSDLVPLLLACAQGDVSGVAVEWSDRPAVGIVLAAKAYPASSEPTAIQSVPEDADGRIVFHAGTALENGGLMATGGRVLTAVASGSTFAEAQDHAYELASKIEWAGGRYRRDIGSRAVERKAG